MLTETDRAANSMSDLHARTVARADRVQQSIREGIDRSRDVTSAIAQWVVVATHLANKHDGPITRDSTATRAARRGRKLPPAGSSRSSLPPRAARLTEPRPPALGGHVVIHDGAYVRCVCCRRYSSKVPQFVRARCPGSAATRWADRAEADAQLGIEAGGGHHRLMSGSVVWCSRCGSYATSLARGLTRACRGPPPLGGNSGGRLWQLRRLKKGFHPVTGARLPRAVPELHWGTLAGRSLAGERWSDRRPSDPHRQGDPSTPPCSARRP